MILQTYSLDCFSLFYLYLIVRCLFSLRHFVYFKRVVSDESFNLKQLNLVACWYIFNSWPLVVVIVVKPWLGARLVQAAITNYHKLRGVNNKPLFFTVLEAGSLRSGFLVSASSWFAMAIFSCILTWGTACYLVHCLASFYKDTDPLIGLHPHDLITS